MYIKAYIIPLYIYIYIIYKVPPNRKSFNREQSERSQIHKTGIWDPLPHYPLMQMLQRKRSEGGGEDSCETLLPLDDEQQGEVIESLKRTARDQAAKFRRLFSAVFAIIALIFLFCLVRLLMQPDDSLPHEDAVSHLLSRSHFLCFYTLSIANFAGCSYVCTWSSSVPQSATSERELESRVSYLQPLIVLSLVITATLLAIFLLNGVSDLRVTSFSIAN